MDFDKEKQKLAGAVESLGGYWQKQERALDQATNFVYSINSYNELLCHIDYEHLDDEYKQYAIHRWYNYMTSKICENIFAEYGAIKATREEDYKHIDIYINNEPFDVKISVFPRKEEVQNMNLDLTQKADRDKLIRWFYANQSKDQRNCLNNRIFIVCEGKNTSENNLLKQDFKQIDEKIADYMKALQATGFSFNEVDVTDPFGQKGTVKAEIIPITNIYTYSAWSAEFEPADIEKLPNLLDFNYENPYEKLARTIKNSKEFVWEKYRQQKDFLALSNVGSQKNKRYLIGGITTESPEVFEHLPNFNLLKSGENYESVEESLSEIEKKDEYILVRSNEGKITPIECSWNHIQRRYPNALVISGGPEIVSRFWEDKGFTEKEEDELRPEENCMLISTLFKINRETIKEDKGCVKAELERVYDNQVVTYLKKGQIFNAVLPGSDDKTNNVAYTYSAGESELKFLLPKNTKTRMLFMELTNIEEKNAAESPSFAEVRFYKVVNNSKGQIKLPMNMAEYNSLEIPEVNKKSMTLIDEKMGCVLTFSCWIEDLPIPGMSDSLFAYLDGSSSKSGEKGGKEVFGTGYAISHNRDVYFGHSEGLARGANFCGEIQAVTNIFKYYDSVNLPKDGKLTLYFDNTAVGYYPGGLFGWAKADSADFEKDFVINYKKYLDAFVKDHPQLKIVFCHIDAHFDVFGNEMADRLAQVNDEKFKNTCKDPNTGKDMVKPEDEWEFLPEYKGQRATLCKEDGSPSPKCYIK